MTLNYERLNSLTATREFLRSLLDPKKTPKVPSAVRQWARRCLHHYPTPFDVAQLSELAPRILGTEFQDNFTRSASKKTKKNKC